MTWSAGEPAPTPTPQGARPGGDRPPGTGDGPERSRPRRLLDRMAPIASAGGAGLGGRLAVLAGLAGVVGYVAVAEPGDAGVYPPCPSRTVLSLDCPACGGLRGTHALLHGRVGEALDHNLLLPLLVGGLAVVLGLWLLPLVGRPERRLRLPTWAWVGMTGLLAVFAVARNLPFDSLEYLASDA